MDFGQILWNTVELDGLTDFSDQATYPTKPTVQHIDGPCWMVWRQ